MKQTYIHCKLICFCKHGNLMRLIFSVKEKEEETELIETLVQNGKVFNRQTCKIVFLCDYKCAYSNVSISYASVDILENALFISTDITFQL